MQPLDTEYIREPFFNAVFNHISSFSNINNSFNYHSSENIKSNKIILWVKSCLAPAQLIIHSVTITGEAATWRNSDTKKMFTLDIHRWQQLLRQIWIFIIVWHCVGMCNFVKYWFLNILIISPNNKILLQTLVFVKNSRRHEASQPCVYIILTVQSS